MENLPTLKRLIMRLFVYFYLIFVISAIGALYFYQFRNGENYKLSSQSYVSSELNEKYDPPASSLEVNRRNYLKRFDKTIKNENTSKSDKTEIQNYNPSNKIEAPSETKYIYLQKTAIPNVTLATTTVHSTKSAKTLLNTCEISERNHTKLILLWTPFFGSWDYFPRRLFKSCPRCPNCRATSDRRLLTYSDAVIFHCRDLSLADLPSIRLPHQKWVFYCLEAPYYSDFSGLNYMQNMFNWTMTYRFDSDIITWYGTFQKRHPSHKLDLTVLEPSWLNKTKSVVWLSSHCDTAGHREDYVVELRKYIDVDIYGSCGDLVCPKDETDKCFREFAKTYKFFLSFENSICKDYVTEKFFRTLKYNIVPVVFGAGSAYKKVAPPGSYINALSFKSPKHLAFFLAGVSKDFKHYKNYFLWRQDYTVKTINNKECELCNLLHKSSKSSSYNNLRNWWIHGANCQSWSLKG